MGAEDIARSAPFGPGCYMFKDGMGRIIYIGKAKSLKKRVSSYFQKSHPDEKTALLVKSIRAVDFIATSNEAEALILESSLIRRHKPRYNINLLHSERYAYLVLTDEKFPRLLVARTRGEKGRLFGPFVSAEDRDYVQKALIRTFRLRTCKRLPKRPCLRFHIGLCDAPCTGRVSAEEYALKVRKASQVLKGRTEELIEDLQRQMLSESGSRNFEEALRLREEIASLRQLGERQNVERLKKFDEDIINFVVKGGTAYLMLFNVSRGALSRKRQFVFPVRPDFLEDFIVQYYSEHEVPREVIIPCSLNWPVEQFLEGRRGGPVSVTVPKRGTKLGLLSLVKRNVELGFFGGEEKVQKLQDALRLQSLPVVIECFDISHTSGSATVGSMVRFVRGRPDKGGYRRFRIETIEGIDDTRAIAEVVRRRYFRLKKEGSEMPDLVIVDGGKGQLGSALSALEKVGVRLPVISVAKRLEEIYLPGSRFPVRLGRSTAALRFVQEVRDEAHRFALSYHRLLRRKLLSS